MKLKACRVHLIFEHNLEENAFYILWTISSTSYSYESMIYSIKCNHCIVRKTCLWQIYLLVSQSFTMLSRDPETSWCSCKGDHRTVVTQPVCDVRDRRINEPSEQKDKKWTWNINVWSTQCARTVGDDFLTFRTRVPKPDVSVCASWGQAATQWRVWDTVKHLTASLKRKSEQQGQYKILLFPTLQGVVLIWDGKQFRDVSVISIFYAY